MQAPRATSMLAAVFRFVLGTMAAAVLMSIGAHDLGNPCGRVLLPSHWKPGSDGYVSCTHSFTSSDRLIDASLLLAAFVAFGVVFASRKSRRPVLIVVASVLAGAACMALVLARVVVGPSEGIVSRLPAEDWLRAAAFVGVAMGCAALGGWLRTRVGSPRHG